MTIPPGRAGNNSVTVAARVSGGAIVHRLPTGSTAGALLTPARDLVQDNPDRPVVVICRREDLPRVRSLLAVGVRGVVLEEELDATLEVTVAAVTAGQVCVPANDQRLLGRQVLSVREKQVVGLAAMGLSNREIAERLFVVESTVKSHLTSAFGKLGVGSRHEAIDLIVNQAWGVGLGILSIDAEPVPS